MDLHSAKNGWVLAREKDLRRCVVSLSHGGAKALNHLTIRPLQLVEEVHIFNGVRYKPHYERKASRHHSSNKLSRPRTHLFRVIDRVGVATQSTFYFAKRFTADPRDETGQRDRQFLCGELCVPFATA